MYNESHGPSLSREAKRKPALHHLRVYAHPDGTPEKPAWIVEHHASPRDRTPEEHSFTDGSDMLVHIGNASGIPAPESED
jgi:hypothetical protein